MNLSTMDALSAAIDLGTSLVDPALASEASYLHAGLTADERFVLVNDVIGRASGSRGLLVADVFGRESYPAKGITDIPRLKVYGVAVNHASTNHGLVALHRKTEIQVYAFSSPDRFSLLGRCPIRQFMDNPAMTNGAIQWSGDGSRLVAASGESVGFAILEVAGGGSDVVGKQRVPVHTPGSASCRRRSDAQQLGGYCDPDRFCDTDRHADANITAG